MLRNYLLHGSVNFHRPNGLQVFVIVAPETCFWVLGNVTGNGPIGHQKRWLETPPNSDDSCLWAQCPPRGTLATTSSTRSQAFPTSSLLSGRERERKIYDTSIKHSNIKKMASGTKWTRNAQNASRFLPVSFTFLTRVKLRQRSPEPNGPETIKMLLVSFPFPSRFWLT